MAVIINKIGETQEKINSKIIASESRYQDSEYTHNITHDTIGTKPATISSFK
jgi:hypothetical protein